MPLPDPLPARSTATLDARVRARIVHDLLDGGHHLLDAPDSGALTVRVTVDREAGTLRLDAFPEIEDEVETAIGSVRAVVTVEGQPEGRYDDDTGHIEIDVSLHLDVKSLLARDSNAVITLGSRGDVDEPGLSGTGDPFDAGDTAVCLVGQGTFEGGSLDGAALWLVLEGTVADVSEAE
ncbi:hypothetical protein RQM47_11440 [Rubrivirga sp. S365]|uniref:hypothetical protein n=1 Tax=Rubrivirga sp. S365 TaxID=3076080 RepID=UPI0028C57262|nr:hypothetical protein [Rubrivirga sp. S365]MDT7857253.1 hypothetical protein [Rubrivirga sp. S365]